MLDGETRDADNPAMGDGLLAEKLLIYLRRAWGDGATKFAAPPSALTGGFDTTIMAFELDGAPDELSGPLILRLMRTPEHAGMVIREKATHDALTSLGFPAPRVFVASTDCEPLGAPFLIMERLRGVNMWDDILGPSGKLSRLFRLTQTLAEVQARLHALDARVYRDSLAGAGLDPGDFTLAGEVRSISARIERAGLVGLRRGAEWLLTNVPAQDARVSICHGDFHPLNVIMDAGTFSGVVDWSQAIVAEPAYDIACTSVILRFGPVELSGVLRAVFERVRAVPMRRYATGYRKRSTVDMRNAGYYEAMHVLSNLTFAGELAPGLPNPWGDPRTASGLERFFHKRTGVEVPLRS